MNSNDANMLIHGLDTEEVKNLLGPVTKNIGSLLGDLSDLVRFYTARNLEKVFTKWAAQRNGKPPLNETDLLKVMQLLRAASEQSDDEMQTRWATLLETAVTDPDRFLPSFGPTLSQLTAEEVQFLDRLHHYITVDPTGAGELKWSLLFDIYDPAIRQMGDHHPRRPARVRQARLIIDDLERLGILSREERPHMGVGAPLRRTFGVAYHLSEYGLSFLEAVTRRT